MMESIWNNKLTLGTPRGDGDLLHNTRRLATGGFRQRGDVRRRSWNVYLVDKTMEEAYEEAFGAALNAYNAKQIQQGRKSRVKTMQDWIHSQLTKKEKGAAETGKMKRGYDELIIRYGNLFSACPYVYQTNDRGQMVDEKGDVIEPWDTRKRPVPVLDEHGNPIKSIRYYRLVDALTKSLDKFRATYPELFIINASIHCDECGVHMHVDYIYRYEVKNGIGLGCSYSTGLSRICDRLGIKYDANSQKNCALKHWQAHVRQTLKDFMPEVGLQWVDGKQTGRKNLPQEQYEELSDYKAAVVSAQKRENDRKEKQLSIREEHLDAKESVIDKKASLVEAKERALATKKLNLKKREAEAEKVSRSAAETMKAALDTKKKAADKVKELERREANTVALENKAAAILQDAKARAAAVDKKETQVMRGVSAVASREAAVGERETLVKRREANISSLAKKRQFVEENYWIIQKVLKEHPDWLKEAKEEYEVALDEYQKKQNSLFRNGR